MKYEFRGKSIQGAISRAIQPQPLHRKTSTAIDAGIQGSANSGTLTVEVVLGRSYKMAQRTTSISTPMTATDLILRLFPRLDLGLLWLKPPAPSNLDLTSLSLLATSSLITQSKSLLTKLSNPQKILRLRGLLKHKQTNSWKLADFNQ
jgi:hypothetical protein